MFRKKWIVVCIIIHIYGHFAISKPTRLTFINQIKSGCILWHLLTPNHNIRILYKHKQAVTQYALCQVIAIFSVDLVMHDSIVMEHIWLFVDITRLACIGNSLFQFVITVTTEWTASMSVGIAGMGHVTTEPDTAGGDVCKAGLPLYVMNVSLQTFFSGSNKVLLGVRTSDLKFQISIRKKG